MAGVEMADVEHEEGNKTHCHLASVPPNDLEKLLTKGRTVPDRVSLRWCGADHIYVRRLGGTSCANCTRQDAGKRRTYKVAGVARMQVKGVPLLVPMR